MRISGQFAGFRAIYSVRECCGVVKKDECSESLALNRLGSMVTDYGEVILDRPAPDGLRKDIPILGTLNNLSESGVDINKLIFQKKVEALISSISRISDEELSKFNFQLEHDFEYKTRIAEHLMLIIDRLDDLEKAKLLANAYSSFINNAINFYQFRRVARAIERCMIEDMKGVHCFESAGGACPEIRYELVECGLIQPAQFPQTASTDAKNSYKITEFGKLFVKVVFP